MYSNGDMIKYLLIEWEEQVGSFFGLWLWCILFDCYGIKLKV